MIFVKNFLNLFLFLHYANCSNLPSCHMEFVDIKLCKIFNNHTNIRPPQKPVHVNPIVEIKDVLQVNNIKKTLTIAAKIFMEWNDFTVSLKGPNDSV